MISEPAYPPVLSKKDFVSRFINGEFGNRTSVWGNINEFIHDICETYGKGPAAKPVDALFHLRNGKVPGGTGYYHLEWSEAVARWQGMGNKEDWYVAEMIPPALERQLLIQGEVLQTPPGSGRCGLDLFYSTVPVPMRPSLQQGGKSVSGLRARMILDHFLCPNSREWLDILLSRYEGHVVEFSTYSRKWGVLPNYNTIFWEVRLY